jgi:hypothetical protein
MRAAAKRAPIVASLDWHFVNDCSQHASFLAAMGETTIHPSSGFLRRTLKKPSLDSLARGTYMCESIGRGLITVRLLIQTMPCKKAIQGSTADPQESGGLHFVAFGLLQSRKSILALHFV